MQDSVINGDIVVTLNCKQNIVLTFAYRWKLIVETSW